MHRHVWYERTWEVLSKLGAISYLIGYSEEDTALLFREVRSADRSHSYKAVLRENACPIIVSHQPGA
jgi:L-rhamnose mutarotase